MREKVKPRSRREIPAVNKVLDALGEYDLATASKLPRPLVVDLVRRGLSKIRSNSEIPEFESTVEQLHRSLEVFRASRLQPVINGTGIVIHTNFGRAPLTPEAVRALTEIGSGYSNLEYDLTTGDRGHRGAYIENALALLCEAEAATVINNCAAALVLIVHHFIEQQLDGFKPSSSRATKSEVIVSRGELVQIGGGFRIGEIIEAAGATLREVGATNKTTLDDYRRAIGLRSAMILKVHRSNFVMSGFVESPSAAEIAALARKKRARGRSNQQNDPRRLQTRYWSQERDDSESSSQQFLYEWFCRVAVCGGNRCARKEKPNSFCGGFGQRRPRAD